MRIAKTFTFILILFVTVQLTLVETVRADHKHLRAVDQLEGTSWVNNDDMMAFYFKKNGVIEIDDASDTETAHYRVNGNNVMITRDDGKYISATINGNKMSFKMPNGYTVVLEKQK